MSVFSDLLQNYIHEKKVKVMALAKYCELERSTIYKFINGKREPMSAELVEQIAHFIKLTPQETYQFKEAWKMARIGENDYYIRKSIEHFLSDFPNRSSSSLHNITPPHTHENLTISLSDTQNCLLLNSRQALDSAVHHILMDEASRHDGKIALFLQPDYPFLLHLLSTIHPSGTLQIDHIFSLNRTAQFTEAHELYELYYLRNLFPVYMNKLDYRIHCFYTDEASHFKQLSALPYMILTSEYAITCSSDYQMGILYQDPDILQAFIPIRICASLHFRPFRSLPMICLRFSSLLPRQELPPIRSLSFSRKRVSFLFYAKICWKKFLIMIFPEPITFFPWRMLYVQITCGGSMTENLSSILRNTE